MDRGTRAVKGFTHARRTGHKRLWFNPNVSPVLITVGVFSPSVLLRVAARTGELHRRGLSVREIPVASSPQQFAALDDGSLDAALTSPDNVVAYRFLADNPLGRQLDVRIVSAVDRGMGLALYARPGTTTVQDLRGTTIGVDVAASGFAFVLFEILARSGLRRDRDYTVAELGSTPNRLAALLEGRCTATMLNAGSDLRADEAGMVRLHDVTEVAPGYLGTVLAAHAEPTAEVRALATALRATTQDIREGRARPDALAEATDIGLPQHLAQRYVQRLLDPERGLVSSGAVELASLRSVVELRLRHLPGRAYAGIDLLAMATDPDSGLIDRGDTA